MMYHELVGLAVQVVATPQPHEFGLRGKVVWETANLLIIETQRGLKRIPKGGRIFRVSLPGGTEVDLSGDKILGRPEERVKRL